MIQTLTIIANIGSAIEATDKVSVVGAVLLDGVTDNTLTVWGAHVDLRMQTSSAFLKKMFFRHRNTNTTAKS